jgi:hypothetical protein
MLVEPQRMFDFILAKPAIPEFTHKIINLKAITGTLVSRRTGMLFHKLFNIVRRRILQD